MKKILKSPEAVLGALIFLGGIGLLWFGYSFKKSLEPKVDPSLYTGIVKARNEQSNRYSFLPPRIPEDATKVAFFHIPSFLQGGDVIALRVSLPAERAMSVMRELETSGRQEITAFEGIPSPNSYPGYGPGSKNMSELPEDFRIFLYMSDLEDIRNRWNHNILSFTAVSTQRHEVVYFIDNW